MIKREAADYVRLLSGSNSRLGIWYREFLISWVKINLQEKKVFKPTLQVELARKKNA